MFCACPGKGAPEAGADADLTSVPGRKRPDSLCRYRGRYRHGDRHPLAALAVANWF